jgi:hypothetical protein
MKAIRVMIVALTLSACADLPIQSPKAMSDWDRTLYYARQDVDAGNYFAADRLLDEFVRTHPDTREGREIAFWKAAYMVDPANDRGSLSGGIAALDSYLAADSTGWYRNEATVLRRTAAVAMAANSGHSAPTAVAIAQPSTSTDTVVVAGKSRDEEIASLKDQLAKSKDDLAKVSAELDRIKKRLANPSN